MVRKYLTGKAVEGWKLVDNLSHSARLAYLVIGPGGTAVVPAYYGIKGILVAYQFVSSSSENTHFGKKNLKDIIDNTPMVDLEDERE